MNLPLPALLRTILSLITSTTHSPTNNTNNGNITTTPTSPPDLLPRQGFDPNLIMPNQPLTFYETASALVITNGQTYTTTYIDFISDTAAIPVTPSTTPITNPDQFADSTDPHTVSEAITSYITSTEPPIVSEAITFYITATRLIASDDNVYVSTYIDLETATVGIPIIGSSIEDEAVTVFITTPTSGFLAPSNPTLTDGVREIVLTPSFPPATVLIATSTSGSIAAASSSAALSSVAPTPTPTITTIPSSTGTSPVLDLAPCSTFTGAKSALLGCISSVESALSLPPGGPIIASSTTITASTTTSSNMREKSVTPTTTVTMPYLGAVVAKGKPTFIVGGGGEVEESIGVRERGMLVGWVGVWGLLGVVGFLRM